MKIKLITAYDKNKLIGIDNKLPWNLPEDLTHFKKSTLNKTIIMGKNTYLSLKKPLPNRVNIVISRTLVNTENYKNLLIFKSIESALEYCKNLEEVMVIGGTNIYEQFLPYADELIATEIQQEYIGDAYFPNFDKFNLSISLDKSFFNLESSNGVLYNIVHYVK